MQDPFSGGEIYTKAILLFIGTGIGIFIGLLLAR